MRIAGFGQDKVTWPHLLDIPNILLVMGCVVYP